MNTKQEVLDACTIEGNNVFLPDVQLDRKLYTEVNKALTGIGGKWNRSAKAHVFPSDPSKLMGRVTAGENVNLKKEFQFFETPEELADELVRLAFEVPHHIGAVLEPSAGQGRIIDAIHRHDPDIYVYACEKMPNNVKILEEKYGDTIGLISKRNFLDIDVINYYEKIIANPPFTKGQDIEHFKHMYEVCAPNGTIVSVMSASWVHNTSKKFKDFRKWLGFDEINESWKDRIMRKEMSKGSADVSFTRLSEHGNPEEVLIKSYPAGTFKSSGTNVITTVIRLRKNDVSGF